MPGFSAGIATFASCDKAGSIPHFTQHLAHNPNDYRSLFWRGRAYSIIRDIPQARADFIKASGVSYGAQKLLADAEVANLDGDQTRKVSILQKAVKDYPTCEDAWGQLGSTYLHEDNQQAYQYLTKAVTIAEDHSRTSEPSYCWYQHDRGNLLLNSVYIDEAAASFQAAVNSCRTHTVSHIGCCKTHIVKEELLRARQSFSTARSLNPKLVKWETFESFRDWFNANSGDKIRMQYQLQNQTSHARISTASGQRGATGYGRNTGVRGATGGQRGVGGGGVGNHGGGGGGGDSSGSEDEGNGENIWQKLQSESRCILKDERGSHRYVQSRDGKFWYSRDKAGHAGAFVKIFEDKATTINFIGSLDRNMDRIPGKHESREGKVIKKKDLVVVKKK